MAPLDNLSPPGSSMYSSNTMNVGDGTWDATRNDFLLPNLVGLNFETMRYNGMGNRFRDLPQYHTLIKGHGIIAAITFLFIIPASMLTARFYGRNPGWALRMHIYLEILTVALSTVVFILGWFAVGPERSLSNPHHGIGLAIYVIILVQALGGGWIYRREKGKARRKVPVKLVMHQWLGRMVALLGIAQVPLGLTLYGSPKFTFVLYTLWMTFLLVLYFVLSYRAMAPIGAGGGALSSHGGTIIEEKKKRSWLGPAAAGAGIAALLARRRSKKKERERSRSRSRSRLEVIPSRRGSRRDSDSFIEEEKYEQRHDEGGGFMSKLLKGGAIIGAGALAKNWYDRRQRRKEEDEYSSVAPDTPSRRHGRHGRHDSVSSDSLSVHRMEEGHRPGGILPGPGDPLAAAAAISAAERPAVPRPTRPARRHSFDSSYYTDSLSAANSPSRRPQSTHKLRNSVLAGVGLGWAAKKWRDRSKKKEQDRLDQLEEDHRIEEERRARHGKTPTKYTGDGHPSSRKHGRRGSRAHSSDLSSVVVDDVHAIRPGAIPPIPAALAGGIAGAALASGGRSSSRHDLPPSEHPSNLPPPTPHFPQAESGSEQYYSSGGAVHRRHSSRRRREGEAAAAAAAAGAADLAAEEAARRRRSRSRDYSQSPGQGVASPPVSVKVKMHGDKDRNVTLRRLTEQEVAAEREARRSQRRHRADSLSSLSGNEMGSNRRRYRRDRRDADERAAEKRTESSVPPPPVMPPLSPPNPAFAGGRKPKDSAYYSGRPEGSGTGGPTGPGSVGSPESHGTWSAMSPPSGSETPADKRRRRRLERNQRPSGTVDYS